LATSLIIGQVLLLSKASVGQVRRWIVSNKLYNEVLKPVLTQRIEKGYNDLDEGRSMKIDMIDKFISLIIRLETLE
jgi:hypothetical protein